MKTVAGAYIPDEGEIYIKGERVSFTNPKQAQDKGIAIIYQDLALANILSVVKNIFMGKELKKFFFFADDKKMKAQAESVLEKLKTTVKSIEQPVSELSGGQQHSVATARIMVGKTPEIIIMDEPTAGQGAWCCV
jgi:ABC-type sugar transport system ATPase subunit